MDSEWLSVSAPSDVAASVTYQIISVDQDVDFSSYGFVLAVDHKHKAKHAVLETAQRVHTFL